MLIIDCWIDKKKNKTAVYCKNVSEVDFSKISKVQIDHIEYDVVGFDVLTSISGDKNAMLLLDTVEKIQYPQEVTVL